MSQRIREMSDNDPARGGAGHSPVENRTIMSNLTGTDKRHPADDHWRRPAAEVFSTSPSAKRKP
ncbi:hypothetical protein ACNKHW_12210 [Shigella flexneri]